MGDKIIFVATFKNARATILAESCCVENSIAVKVVATPTNVSAECGMSLEICSIVVEQFSKLMEEHKIKFNLHER